MSNPFDFINLGNAVNGAIGKRVRMETVEGLRRSGTLTNVRWRDIKYVGPTGRSDVLRQPVELILDGDEGDPVPWVNLVAFARDVLAE